MCIRDSFGGEKVPGDFIGKWMIYFHHFDTINWWNTIVSIVSIIIIAITPRFSKKIPGSLIAIVVVTLAVYLMKTYGGIDCIQTIGDRFTIKSELPDAVVPALNWEAIREDVYKRQPYLLAGNRELPSPLQHPYRTSMEINKADKPPEYHPMPIHVPNKESLSSKHHHIPVR